MPTYEELKLKRYPLETIARVVNNDFDKLLTDIALNKQWKVAGALGLQPAYLSVMVTTIKSVKGL